MSTLLIINGMVITMNPGRDILQTDLLIENDRITRMEPGLQAKVVADEVLDACGKLIMPGLVQGHTHATQALFRGLCNELELMDWLAKRTWPLEGAHSADSNAASARLMAAELIRSGTTSVIDMGTSHHQDAIFETMRDVGLRGLFGKCMLDFGDAQVPATLLESTEDCLRESERLMNTWHMTSGGRIRYAMAPRFVPSCSEELLIRTRDMARANGLRIHTHASENQGEIKFVETITGMRNVNYLHKIGYTGEDVILAHCVWLDDEEMNILAETGTHIVHCPSSNTKLASGIARVDALLDAGCNVALGLDGAHNHMDGLVEMRLAAGLQKVRALSPTVMHPQRVLEMATLGGARALGQEADLGSLEVGKKADLVILNMNHLNTTPTPHRDPVSHVVYQATNENVEATMVDGVFLYRNGKYVTLDLEQTLDDANRFSASILAQDSIQRLFA